MSEEIEKNEKGDLFSKSVRAGKRTYFFDVKSTRGNDYYLTITESKKRFGEDGKFFYEKHKIFLYKEDFNRFMTGLTEVVNHVKTELMPDYDYEEFSRRYDENEEYDDDDNNNSERAEKQEQPAPKVNNSNNENNEQEDNGDVTVW